MSERPPIAWDAVAAELSTRQAAEQPPAWDLAAAQLARSIGARETPGPERAARPDGDADGPGMDLLADDPDDPDDVGEELPVPAPPVRPPADPAELRGGLEALLFVVDGPVDDETLAAALGCTLPEVRAALQELAQEHQLRAGGVALHQVAGGWRFYTRDEHAGVVERYLLGGQRNRLTQAALETLAVIAYRQPVTRARVSAIRGVGVDGVMRTLVSRGLVREVGSEPGTGGGLYGTTPLFLERLGLRSLADLPELGPLVPDAATVPEDRPRRGAVDPGTAGGSTGADTVR